MKKLSLNNLTFNKERIVNFDNSLNIKGGTGTGEFTFVYYVDTVADAWNQTCHECGFGNNTNRHGPVPSGNWIKERDILFMSKNVDDCRFSKGQFNAMIEELKADWSFAPYC
jgi:hypothetical protein